MFECLLAYARREGRAMPITAIAVLRVWDMACTLALAPPPSVYRDRKSRDFGSYQPPAWQDRRRGLNIRTESRSDES